jgi:hypothetical protein
MRKAYLETRRHTKNWQNYSYEILVILVQFPEPAVIKQLLFARAVVSHTAVGVDTRSVSCSDV